MEMVWKILSIICLAGRIACTIWGGFKFFTGDKEKISTLWYAALIIMMYVSNRGL